MAVSLVEFCYRFHQLGKLIHVRFSKKANGIQPQNLKPKALEEKKGADQISY